MEVEAILTGRLGNAVCRFSRDKLPIERRSEVVRRGGATVLVHRAGRPEKPSKPRADVPFEDFRGPFTAAEGWGTFEQKKAGDRWTASITVRHGKLCVRRLRLPWLGQWIPVPKWNGSEISRGIEGGEMCFKEGLVLKEGDVLSLE